MKSNLRLNALIAIGITLFSPFSAIARGGADGGGGDGIAAQYTQVAQRVYWALDAICEAAKNSQIQDPDTANDCSYVTPTLEFGVYMTVEPRSRNTVKEHFFGKPVDAYVNNLGIIFLDVDRWTDLENGMDPNQISAARIHQITLVLHEILVRAQDETNDSYPLSNAFVQLLLKNNVDFGKLVGNIPQPAPPKTSSGSPNNASENAIVAQYSLVAQRVYNAIESMCAAPATNEAFDVETAHGFACAGTSTDPNLRNAVYGMNVEARSLNTILGPDKKPREAGNDHMNTVFLDADRWIELQNETNPNELMAARIRQVTLALHEPLVLAHYETDDSYILSSTFVNLLLTNNFNFESLVGSP